MNVQNGIFGDGEFGALGNWEKIDEEEDSSITRQKEGTCVAAVGEMLARHHGLDVSQDEILEVIKAWSNAEDLGRFLNSKEARKGVEWKSGFFDPDEPPEMILGVTDDIKVWAALLRDSEAIGHAVLVDGLDENGLIRIKDPFDQTTYKMTVKELHRVLSEFVVVVKYEG